MNMDESLRQKQDRIRGEAERRFAQQSPRERAGPPCAELAQWLQASSEHARAYAATRDNWERLDRLQDDPDMRALSALVQSRLGIASTQGYESRQEALPGMVPSGASNGIGSVLPGRRPHTSRGAGRRFGLRAWSMAAALLVAVAGGVLGWRLLHPEPPPATIFATMTGERRSVTLEDGSAITLNTGTLLEARIAQNSRQLRLQRGEALFEVHSDQTRPFVVQAGNGSVTALGTRFQVRRRGETSIITLLEGSVEVRNGQGRSVMLEPVQQARFNDSEALISVRRVDPEAATGWTRGWLIFHQEALGQAVEEINLYSERQLRLADPALAQLPISGNFKIGDSSSIAHALAALLPLEVDDTGADLVLNPSGRSR